MKKLALTALILVFAGACAHKAKNEAPNNKTSPATTKDQAPPTKTKKSKKATAATTAGIAGSVKCIHNQDERTIEVSDKDGGCETIYTKLGETKAIASSAHGKEHCEEVSAKIQKNLSSAGFSCQ